MKNHSLSQTQLWHNDLNCSLFSRRKLSQQTAQQLQHSAPFLSCRPQEITYKHRNRVTQARVVLMSTLPSDRHMNNDDPWIHFNISLSSWRKSDRVVCLFLFFQSKDRKSEIKLTNECTAFPCNECQGLTLPELKGQQGWERFDQVLTQQQSEVFMAIQRAARLRELVGIFSPISHKGLHQG